MLKRWNIGMYVCCVSARRVECFEEMIYTNSTSKITTTSIINRQMSVIYFNEIIKNNNNLTRVIEMNKGRNHHI